MTLHKKLSFFKSGIRIFGYFGLWIAFPDNPIMFLTALILIVSEIVGIIEEIDE